MLTWEQWESIVIDAQKGNQNALNVLLEESRGIITKVFEKIRADFYDLHSFSLDLKDIYQEVSIKIINNLGGLDAPRTYPKWLTTITENYCINEFKKVVRESRLETINERKQVGKNNLHLDGIEDKRGYATSSLGVFKTFEKSLVEADYENRADRIAATLREQIIDVKIQRKSDIKLEGHTTSELLQKTLRQAIVDKEGLNYTDAEKKLKAIIHIAGKKRPNTEIRYLLANAYFELAHLRMNTGGIPGPEGSIANYRLAEGLFKSLRDKPSRIYASQQIGVSYYIDGNPQAAIAIYKSLLKEVPRSKDFREIKANILRDLGNVQLAVKNLSESEKNTDNCLDLAEDIGGICLEYSKLQKAKISFARRRYDKAYKLIFESLEGVPRYRLLDYVKAKVLLFDYYMATNQESSALELAPFIEENCKTYLFKRQQQKFNNLLLKYRLI